jgi:hypothetical protein
MNFGSYAGIALVLYDTGPSPPPTIVAALRVVFSPPLVTEFTYAFLFARFALLLLLLGSLIVRTTGFSEAPHSSVHVSLILTVQTSDSRS